MVHNAAKSYHNHPAFSQLDHRPWMLPPNRPLLSQVWRQLLFLHWEVDYAQLRASIPESLEIDTYDGKAWIAVVPFDMKKVTLFGAPSVSYFSDFPEINVRTYVYRDGKPGVWFFSLDVPNKLAVWGARTFFHLPYRYAGVGLVEQNNEIHYKHQLGSVEFEAKYSPLERVQPKVDSFETWATERYCLYCQSNAGKVYRAQVHHAKWPLLNVKVEIKKNNLLDEWKLGSMHPSMLYAEHLDVVAYAPELLQ